MMKIFNIPGATGFLTGIFGFIVLFRQVFFSHDHQLLWASNFDPNLIIWIVEWGYHILFQAWDWGMFWNANQFFPHLNSLAYSDSIISAQFFYAPLRSIGFGQLEALYGTFFAVTLLGCSLTDWALRRIGFSKAIEIALIVYVAHFSMPVSSFLAHYQLFGVELAPCFFLIFLLFLSSFQGRYLILLAIIYILASGFSTYFAPMTLLLCLVLSALIFPTIIREEKISFRNSTSRIGWVPVLITSALLFILYFVQIRPYLKLFGGLAKQSWAETETYSARPWSFFWQPAIDSLVYPVYAIDNGYWERNYFPGLILLTLFIVGLFLIAFRRKKYRQIIFPEKYIATYAVALFFIAWVFSLGPQINISQLGGRTIFMPLAIFSKLIPGVDSVRAPGRFGMFLALPLGIFTVYSLRYLLMRMKNIIKLGDKWLYAIVLILLVGDGLLKSPTFPYLVEHKSFYEKNISFINQHEPLAVLPLAKSGHLETISNIMQQLNGSTIHYGWLISGYGSRSTPELGSAIHLDQQFQLGNLEFSSLVDSLRKIGVKKVIIFKRDYSRDISKAIADMVKVNNNVDILLDDDEGTILFLKQ